MRRWLYRRIERKLQEAVAWVEREQRKAEESNPVACTTQVSFRD